LNRIVRAVREKKQVSFQYSVGKALYSVVLAPYRVACFSGFWYLIGNEISTGILKRYALDKITGFKLSKTCLKTVPEQLDDILQGSANIWFTEDRNLEVTLQIDASCSHYFKRRTMYPTQRIIEEREDGSIIVSFKVGQYEAIQNMLKSWIPHILILKPEGLKEAVLKDVKRWIEQQQRVSK